MYACPGVVFCWTLVQVCKVCANVCVCMYDTQDLLESCMPVCVWCVYIHVKPHNVCTSMHAWDTCIHTCIMCACAHVCVVACMHGIHAYKSNHTIQVLVSEYLY
jgi:hypothetical protein